DGGLRFVLWDAETCSDVAEHRFHIAASQCLCRDETRKAECSQVQSRVALANRRRQQIALLTGEGGRRRELGWTMRGRGAPAASGSRGHCGGLVSGAFCGR